MLVHDVKYVLPPPDSPEDGVHVALCSASEEYRDERGVVAIIDEDGTILSIVAETSYEPVETAHMPHDLHEPAMGFVAVEGTCLRMFCVHGTWFLATHKKLDAFDSRWGSHVSFGDLFVKGIVELLKTDWTASDTVTPNQLADTLQLDPTYAYMFVVRPRTMAATFSCKPYPACADDSPVFYAGCVPLYTRRAFPAMTGGPPAIPVVQQNLDCSNNRLCPRDIPWYANGVYIYTAHNQQVGELRKFWVERCFVTTQSRGNEPCIYTRYVQLFWHGQGDITMRRAFMAHYGTNPRIRANFAKIDTALSKLAHKDIHELLNTNPRTLARSANSILAR